MKTLLLLKIPLFLIALCSSQFAVAKTVVLPYSIVVITSDKKPITNSAYVKHRLYQVGGTLEVYNLDAVQSFEDRFSKDLPANEDEARKQFEKRIEDYGAKKFEQEIVQAYKGLFSALVYKVDRYPVIIFDKAQAIYGVTDLKLALDKYEAWRQAND